MNIKILSICIIITFLGQVSAQEKFIYTDNYDYNWAAGFELEVTESGEIYCAGTGNLLESMNNNYDGAYLIKINNEGVVLDQFYTAQAWTPHRINELNSFYRNGDFFISLMLIQVC